MSLMSIRSLGILSHRLLKYSVESSIIQISMIRLHLLFRHIPCIPKFDWGLCSSMATTGPLSIVCILIYCYGTLIGSRIILLSNVVLCMGLTNTWQYKKIPTWENCVNYHLRHLKRGYRQHFCCRSIHLLPPMYSQKNKK